MAIKEMTGLQLLKWSIDYGMSYRDWKPRWTLHITNQCAAGKFQHLLGVTATSHVWACPECSGVDS